jgi:putative oxidoreductase
MASRRSAKARLEDPGMIGTLFGVNADIAALILRFALGSLFIVHGYPKLTSGRKQGEGWMKSMGLPTGLVGFAGFVEFFGGLGLVIGLLTPIIAVLFAIWMVGTTWLAISKLKKKYMGGWELDLTLLLVSLALATLGSGMISLDHLLGI